MGLLSFLSRKTPEAGGLETPFKGQAYDATSPALPPIRGAYPVSGNGPSVLNELSRAAKKRSQAQLTPTRTDPSAPAPLVPRLRSHSQGGSIASLDVDTASLSSRPRSQGRRHRASSRAPSLLGWTSRRDSSHARSEADRDAMTLAPPVPRIPDRHKRDGSSSMGSSRRRGHVDLLDAQSEFRPSDFRSRLQAGGARDYGEDVAERNLGVNGVDLESPAVKAFYALTGGAALAYRSDGSAVDVHGNMYQAERIPQKLKEAAPQTQRKEGLGWDPRGGGESEQRMRNALWDISSQHHDDSSGHRKKTLNALERAADKEERETKAVNRQASVSNRRNSLQDFILSNTLSNSSSSKVKQRPLSMHPAVYVQTGDPAPPPGIPRYRPSTSEGLERSPPARTSPAERIRGLGSTSKPKRREEDTDSHGGSTRGRRTSLSRKKAKAGGSVSSVASHNNRHDSSDDGDIDSAAPPPGIGGSSRRNGDHQNYSRPTTQHSWSGSRGHSHGEPSQPAARPATSSAAQPSNGSSHPRSRSIGGSSAQGRSRLDDIIEHIPVRKSSLYPVNLSLVTPTTTASNHSSNITSHSDDYNTGDTSIDQFYDYEPPKPQPQPQPQQHSRAVSSNAATPRSTTKSSYRTKEEEALTELLAAHRRGKSLDNAKAYKAARARNSNASSSNMDDYASATTDGSDIDSFIEKHKRKQQDNEGSFLTSRDYQDMIKQLPGLFDGMDSSRPPRSYSNTTANGNSHRSRDTPRSMRPQNDRVQAPVYQFSSDDFDSEFASDMDYDDSFDAAHMTLAALSNRAGAQGLDLFDLLDDMPDEKMDARTAVKVRKEMKRQKRVGTLERSERSEKSKGKRPMRPATAEGVSRH